MYNNKPNNIYNIYIIIYNTKVLTYHIKCVEMIEQ